MPKLEKTPHSNEDTVQSKINKYIKIKKNRKYPKIEPLEVP